MAAEQAQLCKRDGTAMAVSLSLCVLHDALGVLLFLASHPLHAFYLVFFARGILALARFFWPLLVSTSLLLAVLATVGPYLVAGGEWPGVRSLGSRTCAIAVAALCAELRADGSGPGPAGVVAQLCSFVLLGGHAADDDAASVLRVEEIMGERQNSLLVGAGGDDDCKESYIGGGTSFLDYTNIYDSHGDFDEKVVISEDVKGSDSDALAEQCCFPVVDTLFVQEMEAEEEEEEEESGVQGQELILSVIDEVSDGVEEKRLECDPVSVEMKRSEPPVQVLEIRKSQPTMLAMGIKKWEPAQAVQIKKCEPVELPEIKECETVQAVQIKKRAEPVESVEMEKNELVKPRSLIAQRIKLWEAQVVSANAGKPSVGNYRDGNSVEFGLKNKPANKDAKKCVRFEADPCDSEKCGRDQQQAQVAAASTQECVKQRQEQEFKDVKEYMQHSESETETSQQCSQDLKAEEETTPAVIAQGRNADVQPEADLQELECKTAQPDEQELEEMEMEEVFSDVTQSSPALWNEMRESPLKSTSIAGRVHSRTSSENLLSEGSPSRKQDKEWKRTLACKLYEERMQLRLCRDRAVVEVEGSDDSNMDMLWEAYEVGSGGNKRRGGKVKGKVDDAVEEGEEEEEDDDEGGSVRQLCCLQALKFSTRKMNFGGGKPSLSKISKVLKRMTALSRMGSRRKQSE